MNSDKKADPQLPELEDPKHPGVFLISKIVLFSVSLFVVLLVIAYYTTTSVSMDFEIPLNGVIQSENMLLYAEEEKASVITSGDKVSIKLNDGQVLEANVASIEATKGKTGNQYRIKLEVRTTDNQISQYITENIGAPFTAVVYTTSKPLLAFMKDKLEIDF